MTRVEAMTTADLVDGVLRRDRELTVFDSAVWRAHDA
jgi:hypothetical protein